MASLGQMSDYEIRLIRIFKTVVECGGFTAAETTLGISRSAISQHMNDLEGRLGFSLCQRGRGGLLTPQHLPLRQKKPSLSVV